MVAGRDAIQEIPANENSEIIMKLSSLAMGLIIGSMNALVGCTSPTPVRQLGESYRPFDRAVFIRSRVKAPEGSKSDATGGLEPSDNKPEKRKFRMITGTGFFVHDSERLYFVSAKHVAENLAPHTQLAFLNKRGESKAFRLGQLLRGPDDFKWKHHPDADVSVIELFPHQGVKQEVMDLSLSSGSLASTIPPRATKAVICGFPMGQGTHGKISSITTVVHVASKRIPIAFAKKLMDAFLVSPPAGSGFSGGPVFYEDPNTHKYVCIGLLSGSIADVSGGKLSTVMPAEFILNMLKAEEHANEPVPSE